MDTYSKSDLQNQANTLKKLIDAINQQAQRDFITNKISQEQFSNINLDLQFLDNNWNRLRAPRKLLSELDFGGIMATITQ